MTIEQQLEALAKGMNMSVHDVRSMASMIASGIRHDGVAGAFINAADSMKVELAQAYAVSAAKKAEKIQTTYLTKGREALQSVVIAELESEK